jgi:hypothetical protein
LQFLIISDKTFSNFSSHLLFHFRQKRISLIICKLRVIISTKAQNRSFLVSRLRRQKKKLKLKTRLQKARSSVGCKWICAKKRRKQSRNKLQIYGNYDSMRSLWRRWIRLKLDLHEFFIFAARCGKKIIEMRVVQRFAIASLYLWSHEGKFMQQWIERGCVYRTSLMLTEKVLMQMIVSSKIYFLSLAISLNNFIQLANFGQFWPTDNNYSQNNDFFSNENDFFLHIDG